MNLHSLKVLVARALCHPAIGALLAKLYRGRISSRGFSIDVRGEHIPPRTVAYLFWNFYEKAERDFVDRYLRDDLDAVELGSSLGVVALHIRRKQRGGRKLVTVEANPRLIRTIQSNLEANFPSNEVLVLNRAVDYTGIAEVTISLPDDHLASSVQNSNARSAESLARVKAITLSRVLTEHAIGDYVLVCDIEGAEAGIIFQDAEALGRCKQIIIELHACYWQQRECSVNELAAALQEKHGFKPVASHGPVHVFEKPR